MAMDKVYPRSVTVYFYNDIGAMRFCTKKAQPLFVLFALPNYAHGTPLGFKNIEKEEQILRKLLNLLANI